MIDRETIEKEARDYADNSSSDIDEQMFSFYAYKAGATKYSALVQERDKEIERLKAEIKSLKEELDPNNYDINYDMLNPDKQ